MPNCIEKTLSQKEQHIENNEIAETSGKIASNSIARFSVMAESHIGQIFANQGIDIYTALKQNAIILFILDPLSYPELSPKLGRLILIDSKKAVSRLYRERMNRCFFFLMKLTCMRQLLY